jgi:glycosyltransferase involved in cell wall biosynthesis
MKSPSLISIILPVRNAEETIRVTLFSVLQQTLAHFELLIADDGSTDRTQEIVRSFNDPRIRILYNGQSLGISRRLNQMIQLAKGRYIARMDADDIMHPRRLELQYAYLEEHSNIDVLGTDAWKMDTRYRVFAYYRSDEPSNDPWSVVKNGVFIHPACMGKAEWFRANPYPLTPERAEDRELWTQTCATSSFAVIHTPLLFYRIRDTNQMDVDISSQEATDQQILRWGTLLGRTHEAERCVQLRIQQRKKWILTGKLGLRAIKRSLTRIYGSMNALLQPQRLLNTIVQSASSAPSCAAPFAQERADGE